MHGQTVDLTGILYIIDGTIYQAPSIESLLQARLLTAHHHLSKGLQSLEQSARFAPSLVPQGSDPCLWAEQVERWENARKDLLAKDALKNNSTDTHNATTPDEDSAAMGRMALGALSQRIAEILKDEQFV